MTDSIDSINDTDDADDQPKHRLVKYDTCTGCRLLDDPIMRPEPIIENDILIVGGYPTSRDIEKGPFMSKGGYLVRNILKDTIMKMDVTNTPSIAYTYGLKCCPDSIEYKVKKEDIDCCKRNLWARIDRTRPKLIIALGKDALMSLGISLSVTKVRGAVIRANLQGTMVPVIGSFHPVAVLRDPGLVPIFKNDLKKALQYVTSEFENEAFDIRMPIKYNDIIAQFTEWERALNASQEKGKKLLTGIDTETTSLQAFNPIERMIAISVSFHNNQGFAFPWKHREFPFTEQEMQGIYETFNNLLQHPALAVSMHNAKFDQQWLKHKEKLKCPMASWDTQIVEHILDEDKKGNYSLKTLTADRFPGSAKYEALLQGELQRIRNERTENYKEIVKVYADSLKDVFVPYWISLTNDERTARRFRFLDELGIPLEVSSALTNIRYKKLTKANWEYDENGVLLNMHTDQLLKSCSTALFTKLKRIPPEILGVEGHPDMPQTPVLPEDVTFEDIDPAIMLRYAAIDAIVTRKIAFEQIEEMTEEDNNIAKLAEKQHFKTRPARWAMNKFSNPMQHIISGMEYTGVNMDRENIQKYIDQLDVSAAEAKETFNNQAGYEVNPGSAVELSKLLYDELGFPVLKLTDSGQPSTDAETIKFLADENDNPILEALLIYRKLTKCRDTYLKNWLNMSAIDGHLHGQFNLTGTATYRLSSSSPNLQNVPYQLKEANLNLKALFLPDSDEYDFYDLDIANAEMRVLCAYSRDEALINAFNTGKDLHCLTAAGISGIDYDLIYANKEDKTTEEYRVRQIAKKVNFG